MIGSEAPPAGSMNSLAAGLTETLAPDGSVATAPRGEARPPVGRGTLLGRYVVLGELGRGAMGAVYEAFDPQLERKVALKVMHRQSHGGADPTEGSARMLREAQAMAKLSHRNVITVFDVGTVDGQVFLAMELIDGGTLKAWLERPRTLREKLEVLAAAGEGLAAAHRAGVVHRDFKPDNVLVGRDGRVVVLDFGLATAAVESASEPRVEAEIDGTDDDELITTGSTADLTRTGAIMGTPAYMAPEQHLGHPVDARTDQFAFCVTTYEALTGVRPFAGETLAALAFQVVQGKLRAPPAGVRVPRAIDRALRRGMSRDPVRRFESMEPLLVILARDPRALRRRRLVAGCVLAGAALVGGTLAMRERARIADCDDNADAIADLWSDAQREQARARFMAGHKIGADMFRRVDDALVAYRESWQQLDAAVCRDRVDERTVALQRLCLAEAQVQLRTVAELAATAPDAWIPNAVGAAEGLPRLDDCWQIDLLADRFPLPPEESAKAKVIDLRIRLARAGALMDAELYDDARALVSELGPEVEAAAYPPLDAELALIEAGVQASLGELGPAEETSWRATALAHRADHTAMEAEAWAHLIFHVGRAQARPEEVMHWLPVAEAALQAANAPSLEPMFAGNVGTVYFTLEDYEQARAHFEEALARAVELRGPDSLNLVSYLNNIGTAYAIQERNDEARPYFERALAIRRKYYGDDHPDVASVLHNLGLLALGEGDDDEAERLLQETLAVRRASLPDVHPDLALTLGMIGNVWYTREDYAKAADYYRQALGIRTALHRPTHPEITSMQSSLGLALGKAGQVDEARTVVQRAIDGRIAEHGRDNVNVAESYENLAVVEDVAGDHAAAVAAQRAAIEIKRATGADADALAYARNIEANLLVSAGQADAALALVVETLALPELTATARAWTWLERARAQLAAGGRAPAQTCLREAFQILQDDADELPALAPPLVAAWRDATGDPAFAREIERRVRELAPNSRELEALAASMGDAGG